MVTIWRITFF